MVNNFSFELFMRFSQNMPVYFSYTIVLKSQEWLKTQDQGWGGGGGGGSCLKSPGTYGANQQDWPLRLRAVKMV